MLLLPTVLLTNYANVDDPLTGFHATLDLRLKELPPEPLDVTSILKCINKLCFLEVKDYDGTPQQLE